MTNTLKSHYSRQAANIEYRDPHSIPLSKRQLRKHSQFQQDEIIQSIKQIGDLGGVLLSKDGSIIDGELRVIAARKLGIDVAVIQTDLDGHEARRARIALNKIPEHSKFDVALLAEELHKILEFDPNTLGLGFEPGELDQILSLPPALAGADDLLTAPERPVSEVGDLWLLGEHRLICGNSLEPAILEQLVGGEAVGACISDPPYDVPIQGHVGGKGKHKHREFVMGSGELGPAGFLTFNSTVLRIIFDTLSPGRFIYWFMDWRGSHISTNAALEVGLQHINTCVWVKTNGGMGSLYRSKHELVLVFAKPGGKSVNNVQLGRFGRNRTNVWEYPGANAFGANRDEHLSMHPTVKPTALIEDAIKDCTLRGEWVLDPFGGSGTLILAADSCGRRAMLCELDPGYVDVAIARFMALKKGAVIHAATGLTFDDIKAQRLHAGSKKPQPPLRRRLAA